MEKDNNLWNKLFILISIGLYVEINLKEVLYSLVYEMDIIVLIWFLVMNKLIYI